MFRKKNKHTRLSQNKVIFIAAISSLMVGLIIIVLGLIYYKYRITELGLSETPNNKEYKYHYAFISEDADSTFWKEIYQGAMDQAKEQNAYIEKTGSDLAIKYSLQDLMRIAIASKVNGIILEPNGDSDMIDLINQAQEADIPVVTVLGDITESKRISYVGINSYAQGQVYAYEVLKAVKDGAKKITVLLNEDMKDTSQKVIYSSILEAVSKADVTVKSVIMDTKDAFNTEENIRKIIMDAEYSPDLLVCLTEVDTLCANRAVVDYNKVGDVEIIGYYNSEVILRAIEKNIVRSTMTLDAKQMGAYCVEALMEYSANNNVSDYYSVDISVINKDNVQDYIENVDKKEEE